MNDVTVEDIKSPVPILYSGVYQKADGHEGSIDLEEEGWLKKVGLKEARVFTLQPKAGSGLPVVSVNLDPLADGTERELVFFSRVYGRLAVNTGAQTCLFRMYCVGWKAAIPNGYSSYPNAIAALNWIYPSGSIVAMALLGDELEDLESKSLPPYVNELIEHYATTRIGA